MEKYCKELLQAKQILMVKPSRQNNQKVINLINAYLLQDRDRMHQFKKAAEHLKNLKELGRTLVNDTGWNTYENHRRSADKILALIADEIFKIENGG